MTALVAASAVPGDAAVAGPAAAASAAPPGPTAAARDALGHLADLAVPPPVPWTPQTPAWAVLAAVLLALAAWGAWRGWRHWRDNRYRREALRLLAGAEAGLDDAARREAALRALPPLLKRCALAAWPRDRVAALHGEGWTTFLAAQARGGLDPALARLLDADEYRAPGGLMAVDAADARAALAGARDWVRHHRVRREDRRVPA